MNTWICKQIQIVCVLFMYVHTSGLMPHRKSSQAALIIPKSLSSGHGPSPMPQTAHE